MKAGTIRAWSWVHKWTSLVCTVFLLMLCVTGLPLVFTHELEEALMPHGWEAANPDGPRLSLDEVLADDKNQTGAAVPAVDAGGR